MRQTCDTAIFGFGANGSAIAWEYTKPRDNPSKKRVLCFERYGSPGHNHGASGLGWRIIRLTTAEPAPGVVKSYVPLAVGSHQLRLDFIDVAKTLFKDRREWLFPSPFLTIGHGESDTTIHHDVNFLHGAVNAAVEFRRSAEIIDRQDLRDRFSFLNLGDSAIAVLDRKAYVSDLPTCIVEYRDVIQKLIIKQNLPSELRFGERLISFKQQGPGGSVDFETDKGRYSTGKLVLAGGPWNRELMPPRYQNLLGIFPQDVVFLKPKNGPDAFARQNEFGALRLTDGQDYFFAIKMDDCVKIGGEQHAAMGPANKAYNTASPKRAAYFKTLYERYIGEETEIVNSGVCNYNMPLIKGVPHGYLVLGPLEECDSVYVVEANAGHAAKLREKNAEKVHLWDTTGEQVPSPALTWDDLLQRNASTNNHLKCDISSLQLELPLGSPFLPQILSQERVATYEAG